MERIHWFNAYRACVCENLLYLCYTYKCVHCIAWRDFERVVYAWTLFIIFSVGCFRCYFSSSSSSKCKAYAWHSYILTIIYAYGVTAMCVMYNIIGSCGIPDRWFWICVRFRIWFFPIRSLLISRIFSVWMRCLRLYWCVWALAYNDANSYYEWFNLYA